MQAIVAIGGGEMRFGETRAIDEYIVRLAGKPAPRALFIPTASGDHTGYIDVFTQAYAALGYAVDVLRLYGLRADVPDAISAKFAAADLVYVGGGDTEMMMAKWRARGVDEHLRAAWERGVVLAGLSAGALCWAAGGMTDRPVDDDLIPAWVEGMNLLPYALGVHYDEPYWQQLDRFAAAQDKPVIALENCTALSFVDGRMTIIRSREDRQAWLLRPENGLLRKEPYTGGAV